MLFDFKLFTEISTGPIRTFIQIESFGQENDVVDSVTLFSEPVIKDWPRFGISPPYPPEIHMKNTTIVSISVTNLTRSLEDSYLKMYMPTTCEDCDKFEGKATELSSALKLGDNQNENKMNILLI